MDGGGGGGGGGVKGPQLGNPGYFFAKCITLDVDKVTKVLMKNLIKVHAKEISFSMNS